MCCDTVLSQISKFAVKFFTPDRQGNILSGDGWAEFEVVLHRKTSEKWSREQILRGKCVLHDSGTYRDVKRNPSSFIRQLQKNEKPDPNMILVN